MEVSCVLRLSRDPGSYFGRVPRDIINIVAEILRWDAIPCGVFPNGAVRIDAELISARGGALVLDVPNIGTQLFNIRGQCISEQFRGIQLTENKVYLSDSEILDVTTGRVGAPVQIKNRGAMQGIYITVNSEAKYYDGDKAYDWIEPNDHHWVYHRLGIGRQLRCSPNLTNQRIVSKSRRIKGLSGTSITRIVAGPRGEAVIVKLSDKIIIVRKGRSITCDHAVEHPRGLITQTGRIIRFMPWKGQSKALYTLHKHEFIRHYHCGYLATNKLCQTIIYPLTE